MNKDLRQEIAKIITPAWPSSSLLRADKIIKLVLDNVELELEAWFDVHEERQRTFKTSELLEHIRKNLK